MPSSLQGQRNGDDSRLWFDLFAPASTLRLWPRVGLGVVVEIKNAVLLDQVGPIESARRNSPLSSGNPAMVIPNLPANLRRVMPAFIKSSSVQGFACCAQMRRGRRSYVQTSAPSLNALRNLVECVVEGRIIHPRFLYHTGAYREWRRAWFVTPASSAVLGLANCKVPNKRYSVSQNFAILDRQLRWAARRTEVGA